MNDREKCMKCDGCGRVADNDDETPWCYYETLPVKSAAAVVMGLVHPQLCSECGGTGLVNVGSAGKRYWYQQFEQQRAEAARYRAALEEIRSRVDDVPICGELTVYDREAEYKAALTFVDDIAHRALHPEDET